VPTPPTTPGSGPGATRAPAAPAPAPTPASTSGATPAPPSSAGAPTPPPAPLTLDQTRSALRANAGANTDIIEPLALQLGGTKTADELNAEVINRGFERKLIEAYLATGPGSAKQKAQTLGRRDTVAVQKFADIDGEQHMDPAHAHLLTQYYTDLVAKMNDPVYTDRGRTYEIMKGARGHNYCFRGKKIPASRLSPHSTRNQSVETLYDRNGVEGIMGADITRQIDSELRANGVTSATEIARQQADVNMRKKAYRHLLASGSHAPMSTFDTSGNITSYGTWYHPGEITALGAGDTGYQQMMRLGALQPEWYPHGTVVLTIDLTGKARDARKPTCFDGLLSAVWTSRNVAADDYGLTGGGAAEFLEANIPWAQVTSARAVIPSDQFCADIQRVATQVRNATDTPLIESRRAAGTGFVPDYTPTAERARGNNRTTSILNTTVGRSNARGLYDDMLHDTQGQHNATGAGPTVPRAPASGAPPGATQNTPPAAAGGPWNPSSGPGSNRNPGPNNSATTPPRLR